MIRFSAGLVCLIVIATSCDVPGATTPVLVLDQTLEVRDDQWSQVKVYCRGKEEEKQHIEVTVEMNVLSGETVHLVAACSYEDANKIVNGTRADVWPTLGAQSAKAHRGKAIVPPGHIIFCIQEASAKNLIGADRATVSLKIYAKGGLVNPQ